MNRACPELSRRALLGAACAGPFLGLFEGDFLGLERAAHCRDLSVTLGAAATPTVRFEPFDGACGVAQDKLRREAAPSAAEALQRQWRNALALFRRAEATLAALEGHPDEDAFGRAHDRFNLALRRLIATPAPDLPALATKLEIADQAELADLTFAPPSLSALALDARRLALRSS